MKQISLPKRFGWPAAALLLALGVAGLWTAQGEHAMSLTQAELQAGVDRRIGRDIAVKGQAQALLRSIRVNGATVRLRDGKAALAVDLTGELRSGQTFDIEASALGVPRYSEGAFYFDPEKFEVTRLTYEGQSVADLLSRVARSFIPADDMREALEKTVRKVDDWAIVAVDAALRQYLEERPVYRLKGDAKGEMMKAAVQKVEIRDDNVLITFSLWRLTESAIAGFFSLLLGIILSILIIRMILIGETIEISDT